MSTVSSSGSLAEAHGYSAGKCEDRGLYYYRARYYDSHLGRFLNEDSIMWASGRNNFFTYGWNQPISNTDPSGNNVAVEGGLNNILQYVKARNYLMKDSRMAVIIHTLERSPAIYYIHILSGANCNDTYDYKTRTIYWNPTCGNICTSGTGQSPALQLGHEMDHATNPNPNWIGHPEVHTTIQKKSA